LFSLLFLAENYGFKKIGEVDICMEDKRVKEAAGWGSCMKEKWCFEARRVYAILF
jgi:hypothetical protein